mgnify:CR=1 FL=1
MEIIYNKVFLEHDTGMHPENKKRLECFKKLKEEKKPIPKFVSRTKEQYGFVHSGTMKDFHHELVKHYKFDNHEQKGSLYDYSLSSKTLNQNLGRSYDYKTPLADYYQEKATKIDSALKAHKSPFGLTVYTGLKKSPEHAIAQNGNKHTTMIVPTYTSTSIDHNVAKNKILY